jgi:hypothetical protein
MLNSLADIRLNGCHVYVTRLSLFCDLFYSPYVIDRILQLHMRIESKPLRLQMTIN